MTKTPWKIAVDTGGTFTDCIAVSPEGRVLRAKVLSSSSLRGVLGKKTGPRQFRFTHHWPVKKDIFNGYSFIAVSHADHSVSIESIDFQQNILTLTQDILASSPDGLPPFFEITAHEEAPILAARLLTETSLGQPWPPVEMRLGTTKGTNALLEKKTAPTALLITEGFGDLLAIGTQQRPHLFQLNIPEPELLYSQVFEVKERMNAGGDVLKPLTLRELRRIISFVKKSGAEAVAVALLHAWRNPLHELKIREALKEVGIRFISLSHELMPAIKLLPRAQTAVVDAALSPILHLYLDHIFRALILSTSPGPNVHTPKVMTSAGGLVDFRHFSPKDSLLSGPAGGVVGTAAIARTLGFHKVIGFDMGGTSTDASRFDGKFDYTYTTRIGNIEMLSPCLAIETVAAGGGSICWFDGHKLCVGPESAGASPGPASYGAGGPLAITDVNLLLGKLDPAAMGIPVSRERAQEALRGVQQEVFSKTNIHYTEEELLRGFEKIANEKMAEAIRKISVAKGFDPKDYALLAFGGAGGLHACKVAELLEIQIIILPYDGGLLSAFGIGQAQVERFAQRQVLKELTGCKANLPEWIEQLTTEATAALAQEGFSKTETEVKACLIYLRFKGQESSLEVDVKEAGLEALEHFFETKYRQLFGHCPGKRAIEVESFKVVVAAGVEQNAMSHRTGSERTGQRIQHLQPHTAEFSQQSLAGARIFVWDELEQGETFQGPAILLNANSTAYLEENWTMEVAAGKNLILKKNKLPSESAVVTSDINGQPLLPNPIELELFTNRFAGIAEEMGAQLQRTAFSVNIKERLDFSCAILDAQAELLVNAPHIPVHLGSLGLCARLVLEKFPLENGDVIITNHPKYGGSHLPDVTLMSAVYTQETTGGKPELIGYVINRAHHAEIGGKRPGSMPPDATTLEEEGVVISPTYLVKNGRVYWETIENMLAGPPYPTRSFPENLADINAALASLRTGEEKLRTLVQEHGLEKVHRYMTKLKETAADALTLALRPFDNRIFSAREKMDDGRVVVVSVKVSDGSLTIDFTGTGGAHPLNLNANIAIVHSTVVYVLRLLCQKDIPLNEGLMKNVHIVLPPGTFLHPGFEDDPRRCPAVVGGNTEVSQRLTDTLLKAFSPIVKVACSQGTMNNFLFGNEHFGYYETIGGGAGAGEGFNGRSAVHQHMTNTKITDPEDLELRYPVRLHRFSIRKNSCGKGRWRGGDGIVREVEFLEEVDFTIISQHRNVQPYGLEGGQPGRQGRQFVIRVDGSKEQLKGIDSRRLQKGDRIRIETPGGGGSGSSSGGGSVYPEFA